MKFQGIFVPIITPFKPDGSIYKDGVRNILKYLYKNKIYGIWLLGSYGGFPLLNEDERIEVAETAMESAKELNLTVIINVTGQNTDMAVRLAKHAEKIGAHGIASVVPFYYSSTHYGPRNFLTYFKAIVDSVYLPFFFYNNTNTTGYYPDQNFFNQLLDLGVKGLKSKGDYLTMSKEISLVNERDNCFYLSGSTSVHLMGHMLGASGVTSGVALAMPKLITRLQKALENNEMEKALELQKNVLELREIMGKYVGRAVACYDILNKKGIDVGTCRSPWVRMTKSETAEVIEDIRNLEKKID